MIAARANFTHQISKRMAKFFSKHSIGVAMGAIVWELRMPHFQMCLGCYKLSELCICFERNDIYVFWLNMDVLWHAIDVELSFYACCILIKLKSDEWHRGKQINTYPNLNESSSCKNVLLSSCVRLSITKHAKRVCGRLHYSIQFVFRFLFQNDYGA